MEGSAAARVREELTQLWGHLGPFWGVPPGTARVYAFLLSSADPVDGDSIAEELAVSRGAVSMACRELVDWGLIHARRPVGARRVEYAVEDDPEKVIRGIVSTRKRREWDPILENVRSWREALGKERSREAVVLRERLAEIEGMVGLADSMADAFLEGRIVPRLGMKALVAAARRKKSKRVRA